MFLMLVDEDDITIVAAILVRYMAKQYALCTTSSTMYFTVALIDGCYIDIIIIISPLTAS